VEPGTEQSMTEDSSSTRSLLVVHDCSCSALTTDVRDFSFTSFSISYCDFSRQLSNKHGQQLISDGPLTTSGDSTTNRVRQLCVLSSVESDSSPYFRTGTRTWKLNHVDSDFSYTIRCNYV